MENIRWKSLVVIKDTLRCSAQRIWASLVHDAIERNKGQVLVYLFTSCKNSIDIISLDSSFDRVIVLLKEISQYATVIARMHDECISTQNWDRLSSIAHVTYSLELRNMVTPLCTIISYRADGKRNLKVGTIYVDDSFRSIFKEYEAQDSKTFSERNSKLPIPESSFDIGLHLRKSEREAKERVSLPYETAQKEEELVRLHVRENRKIRAGGRIIYTPDEADDLDESDPDDDLEI
ncbi:hypothetical protein ACH3XW_24300 [Acanthocheilonema viteae]